MSLETKIMAQMKDAMKAKNDTALRSLRAIKAEIIKAKTAPGAEAELSTATEQQFLQKMMKQRKDALDIYNEQGRTDLAEKEQEEMNVIAGFLPEQMTEAAITEAVKKIIASSGAAGVGDMGKVMGIASKEMAGMADGKQISTIVKKELASA